MAREIRITVNDDEVFERMKARKQELDLSWREVLQRGLSRGPDTPGPGPGDVFEFDEFFEDNGEFDGMGSLFGDDRREHREGRRAGSEGRAEPPEPGSIGDLADEIKRHVQKEVRESLQSSLGDRGRSSRGDRGRGQDLDAEMDELARAEDALLTFGAVTAEQAAYTVPLRVRLETSRSGLDIEVVAVRTGKSVTDCNRFDRGTRQSINEHLARGGTATLTFENGHDEAYSVAPVLSWSRADDGTPTVSDVEIAEVLFDDGE